MLEDERCGAVAHSPLTADWRYGRVFLSGFVVRLDGRRVARPIEPHAMDVI